MKPRKNPGRFRLREVSTGTWQVVVCVGLEIGQRLRLQDCGHFAEDCDGFLEEIEHHRMALAKRQLILRTSVQALLNTRLEALFLLCLVRSSQSRPASIDCELIVGIRAGFRI